MGGETSFDAGGPRPSVAGMSCDSAERWLYRLGLRGSAASRTELPPLLGAHLEQCPACRREFESAARMPADLREARVTPLAEDPLWVNSVMAQVRPLRSPEVRLGRRRRTFRVAAALLCAITAGSLLLLLQSPEPEKVSGSPATGIASDTPRESETGGVGQWIASGDHRQPEPRVGGPLVEVDWEVISADGSGTYHEFIDRAPENCEWIPAKPEAESPRPETEVF